MHFYGIGSPTPEDFFGVLANSRQKTSTRYQALLDYMRTPRNQKTHRHLPALTTAQLDKRRGKVQAALRKAQLKKHPSGRPMTPRRRQP